MNAHPIGFPDVCWLAAFLEPAGGFLSTFLTSVVAAGGCSTPLSLSVAPAFARPVQVDPHAPMVAAIEAAAEQYEVSFSSKRASLKATGPTQCRHPAAPGTAAAFGPVGRPTSALPPLAVAFLAGSRVRAEQRNAGSRV